MIASREYRSRVDIREDVDTTLVNKSELVLVGTLQFSSPWVHKLDVGVSTELFMRTRPTVDLWQTSVRTSRFLTEHVHC